MPGETDALREARKLAMMLNGDADELEAMRAVGVGYVNRLREAASTIRALAAPSPGAARAVLPQRGTPLWAEAVDAAEETAARDGATLESAIMCFLMVMGSDASSTPEAGEPAADTEGGEHGS